MRYLTDGIRLYEVISEYIVRNYGTAGTFLRGATVQDVQSGATSVVPASRLLTFREVN